MIVKEGNKELGKIDRIVEIWMGDQQISHTLHCNLPQLNFLLSNIKRDGGIRCQQCKENVKGVNFDDLRYLPQKTF